MSAPHQHDGPAPPDATTAPLPPHGGHQPGQMVGRYRLISIIGEGGFGTVWMAEQREPVERRVALKIIKLGMDTRQVIARFEAERQALAMMDHPNIARVLDAGATELGRPYFVMELVRGVPITHYCDQNRLSTRQRLELFTAVCSALQHAHTKGVIHRDIKPSNVLVSAHDGRATPKVIDFGIAKATSQRLTEKTIFTERAQFIGTPEYMSPEQAEMSDLDIDTRTDIYSLGVLLYELLTSSTPFDPKRLRAAGYAEIQRIIREEDPPMPSTRLSTVADLAEVARRRGAEPAKLGRMLRGDLDWIAMKALEKDRTRRYETASELARDVERHLHHEPVLAGPPGAGYRLRKFIKRNRVAVTAGLLVAGALVLGVIGTSLGMAWALRERERAVAEADKAEAINRFLVNDLLAEAGPDRNPVGSEISVRELLDRAASRLDEQRFGRQPEVEAGLQSVIGSTYYALGAYAEAERHWRLALEVYSGLYGREHRDTLAAMAGLAQALDYQNRFDEASALYAGYFEAAQGVLDDSDPVYLSVTNNYAELLRAQGRLDEAIRLHEQNLKARRGALGKEHPDALESMNNLAALWHMTGEPAKAEPLFRATWEARKRVLGEDHPHTLISMSNYAVTLKSQGRLAEAEPIFRQVMEADRRVQGPEHPDTLTDIHNLATLLQAQQKHEEAGQLFRQAIDLRKRVLGETHPVVAHSLLGLGETLEATDRHEDALPVLREALEIRRDRLPAGHHLTAASVIVLARCLTHLERFEEAQRVVLEEFETLEKAGGAADDLWQVGRSLVILYEAWGRPADAARWRERLGAEMPQEAATGAAGQPR